MNNTPEFEAAQKDLAIKVQALYQADKSLKAIAAEVVLPMVEADVQAESILDVVFERMPTKVGSVKWAKKPTHKAYFISEDGSFVASKDKKAFVEPDGYLVTAEAVFNSLDMERGYVAGMTDQSTAAKDAIVKKLNAAAFALLFGAADPANIIAAGGLGLTESKLNAGFSRLEELGVLPQLMLMRGARFNDIRNITLPTDVKADLVRRGVLGVMFSGAKPLLNVECQLTSVYLIGNKLPGRVMDEFPLTQKAARDVLGTLDIEIPMFQVVKMAITNNTRYVRIDCV